ncbi:MULTISPECIES: inner membrane-spanning protein YciB [Wohlfahrtiimonas]|uniref:Septation protein IspZ n=2 Tax=Wohlfahrtiimonas chitiniclastica TaxID=400946 RepID=A0AB35BX17_9GAMM|nr:MULTISPECIES: septation protein IspZ [Wohlfahrtiimonas]ELV08304.1 Putative intracellular septation protein A [Wohlfahrtiimonas chitiniclastica SH04]KZX37425.1 intracellular septation protein A [Wohlfahrtiimonas chitiniclastica]MBS7820129.1 septation protein IspZ [Wohlfahrtiimonas chitiniclastica]MBS7824246.1 septation protein IspZ [Wohlfahrtiimonas chitiniclastica]MBS7828247.1 septation protein IspZ [Wohlfahrtiimonas chitiniclastica]
MRRINIPQIALGATSVAFLAAFFFGGKDLIFATKVLLISAIVAAAACVVCYRQTNMKTWGMLISLLLFSGLTVYFDNEAFIKWRPTVINAVLCIALLVMYFSKTMPFKYFFAKHLELNIPDHVWLKQNLIWMTYFFISGLINTALVVMNVSNEGWVLYKTVIGPILATIFSLVMIGYLYRENKKHNQAKES